MFFAFIPVRLTAVILMYESLRSSKSMRLASDMLGHLSALPARATATKAVLSTRSADAALAPSL